MSSPFLGVDDASDQDTSRLLSEDAGNDQDKYERKGWCARSKVCLSGAGILALVVIGVITGALLNKHGGLDTHANLKRSGEATAAAAEAHFPYKKIRLPQHVVPLKYRIYLHPNMDPNDSFKFTGQTRILITVGTPDKTNGDTNKRIVLHSRDQVLDEVVIFKGDALNPSHTNKKIELKEEDNYRLSHKRELLVINMKEDLPAGTYTVYIRYHAQLSRGMEGFYLSSYKTKAGEKRYLATTHFEPTAARTAFPCFDEPAMKAKFKVIIVREKRHIALSNMPILMTKHRDSDGLEVDHFKESVKMSTYLVAFVVCDFKYMERNTTVTAEQKKLGHKSVKVRVYAPEENLPEVKLAVETCPKILEYYNTFFKIDFPLEKLDLIAIPDFSAGAMENWGLITYRMTSLLYDENESSSSAKQWVTTVIAHELAHQWFGDLVTMKWWNDLWLNEGFASFVENIGINAVQPKWQMDAQFNIDKVQRSMALDAHTHSHQIMVDVQDPAQINEIFDDISYDKGASIIRMMKGFIGDGPFRDGLAAYLKKYKYSNAATSNLWHELTKAAKAAGEKKDVAAVMNTWTDQMGFPVVTITQTSEQKAKGKASVSQKHFIVDADKEETKNSKYNYQWQIPLTWHTQKDKTNKETLMTNASMEIEWASDAGWMKVNCDQLGFYKVQYSKENWKALGEQLQKDHTVLSAKDRANLLDDAFDLARAGELKTTDALDMSVYLKKETEYVPWSTGLGSIGYTAVMLEHRPGHEYYKKYIRAQVKYMANKLGWQDSGTHLQRYLRASMLSTAIVNDDQDQLSKGKKIFNDWYHNGKRISPNLRSIAYKAGMKSAPKEIWDGMLKRFLNEKVPSESKKLMAALSYVENVDILMGLLQLSLNESVIRKQDTTTVISHVSGNPVGQVIAYDFVRKNYNILFKRYGTGSFTFARVINTIFGAWKTEEKLAEVKKFLAEKEKSPGLGSGSRARNQAEANVANHISWLKTNEKSVTAWFKKMAA